MNFSRKVFRVVSGIPEGQVLTYKKVAKMAGSPNAARAVGRILGRNYDFQIPCHRVIKSTGQPGGYNRGAKKKTELLKKEGVKFNRKK